MKKQCLFIFSGPGGAGKTTIVNELFKRDDISNRCMRAVTVTSRKRREEEIDGRDYFFVSKEEFLYLKKRKFFLETQQVAGNHYGTPKLFYTLAKKAKKHMVLCIDVKGGMYLKRNLKTGRIITVFISTPTEKELCQRMKKRAEDKETIVKRVALAKKELQFSKYYDYVITNKTLATAVQQAADIILAHH